MNFSFVDGVFSIECNMLSTVALASIVLLLGLFLRKKIAFFRKYCIPAPVIGGFIFMIIVFAGHTSNIFKFNFNTTMQSILMIAFFTTVGLSADFALIKKGGRLLLIY